MLPSGIVAARKRLVASFAFTIIFFAVFADSSTNDSQVKCSRTCVAENCNSVGIRYGKYCGVGWSGCPGEKPCDDLDACCKIHDECVEKKGLINVKCHEKFKTCIKKVQKSGKVGFSRDCPYETAVPTMIQGMDMAILLSQLDPWNIPPRNYLHCWRLGTTQDKDDHWNYHERWTCVVHSHCCRSCC